MKQNRLFSFIAIFLIYVIATAISYFSLYFKKKKFELSLYIKILIADVIGTIVVFIFSLIFNNASCYDPYWSVAPIVIVIYLLIKYEFNVTNLLVSIAVIGWGIRLTANWAYTFQNLTCEDWRYVNLKKQSKSLYFFVNFFGIHMMPTMIVYLCMLPVMFMFNNPVSFNPLVVVFFVLAICAFTMQGVADYQMHKFRKNKNGTFNRNGLWKYSRHPNYLGEISMWWMVALLAISALGGYWFLVVGASVNTLLFIFISIPLAEKHQKVRKPGFDEYKSETRMLFPIYKSPKDKKVES